jgi:PD-(D/E)XK nuclease superfamily
MTFPQSPSSIGTFNTCPRQYQAKYITKEVVFMPTDATRYGVRMHEALEHGVKSAVALPEEFAHLAVVVEAMRKFPGQRYSETKYAVGPSGEYLQYGDKSVMARCIIDFVAVEHDTAFIVDYKSNGKAKADDLQLRINAVCIFAAFPRVKRIKSAFLYTKLGILQEFHHAREDFNDLLAQISHNIQGIETAESTNKFKPTPSGLCRGWCDVTACSFNKGK